MLIIKAFRMLDHSAVSVSFFNDSHQPQPHTIESVEPVAYATFPDWPTDEPRYLVDSVRCALEVGNRRATALGGWAGLL